MIDVLMKFGGDVILIKVEGNKVLFGNTSQGARMATIDGMNLSYDGVVREFPELKDNRNWRIEAISKFKDKIRELKDEDKIVKYVIEEPLSISTL